MALNCVVMMGRLTADPVLRSTTAGKEVASFRLAVDRGRKDAGADFFDCVAWEKRADFISRYFQKGSMIAITGRLQSRNYEDKNGQKRTAIEIVVNEANFCGGKNDAQAGGMAAPTAKPDVYAGDEYAEIDEDTSDLPF